MSRNKPATVAVLHNEVGSDSSPDDLDVITQVNVVSQALNALNYDPVSVPLSLNLQAACDRLNSLKPLFVFNLVESIAGTGRFIYFAAALLDRMRYPYTGSGTDALYVTTNKPLSKSRMRSFEIATPDWILIDTSVRQEPDFEPPYILKPVWEDASVGLDVSSVIHTRTELRQHKFGNAAKNGDWFAETYIPGREFNISILADERKPEILSVAEIEFLDFPEDRPKIVDYRAKWEADSFEYQHTIRRFDFLREDEPLLSQLREITLKCWRIFNLHGYARVDFRIDHDGKPWVLEINANPCISPDSGFVAAAERSGLCFNTIIQRIINDIPDNRRALEY